MAETGTKKKQFKFRKIVKNDNSLLLKLQHGYHSAQRPK